MFLPPLLSHLEVVCGLLVVDVVVEVGLAVVVKVESVLGTVVVGVCVVEVLVDEEDVFVL